jgi:low temperature requirement protein LtrA
MAGRQRARTVALGEHASVTSIELFFDLVFVFAITQVTTLMANDLTATGALRGILVISVLWWCWVGYAWLGNLVRADEGAMRIALFVAMTAMFIAALTIPESFTDLPGGLSGPVVFAVCYFVVRLAHFGMFWAASTGDPGLRKQLLRFIPSLVIGTTLLLVASQLTGTAQTLLWLAALIGDYLGTVLAGASGWRVNSASHFAERHGLIIIIALGESIVSIGVGVTALPISWPIIVASVLGLTVAGCLWWSYFDVVALVAERVLAKAQGEERARLARDSYSFLHLPMVIGIIFLSLGLKKVLNYVGGDDGHTLSDHLYGLPLIALYGGTSLYLLAHVAFRWRNTHTVNPHRTVVAVLLLALIPVAALLPALATLGLLAAILVALIAFEALRYAAARDAVRHHDEITTSGAAPRQP